MSSAASPRLPIPLWDEEPLALWLQECAGAPDGRAREFRFEYSSRGDRVPGVLRLPVQTGVAAPLVLLAHGTGGAKDTPFLTACGRNWVARGCAVASFDLPLHGERASAKLTQTFLDAFGDRELLDPERERLCAEFLRQALLDGVRCLDALLALPDIDARRVALVGLSLGAAVGAHWSAADPRIRAVALALAGGGIGALDPTGAVARIAPRPLLFVNARGDEQVPERSADALHRAAAEPREVVWIEGGDVGEAGLAALARFLNRHLECKA
jgi:dienelactone hydrolase